VSGADDRLKTALSSVDGLHFAPEPGCAYAARIEVAAPDPSPEERMMLLARIRTEAKAAAPARICAVLRGGDGATATLIAYLRDAQAVTGQVLAAEPEA
jgi:hypothetical protein